MCIRLRHVCVGLCWKCRNIRQGELERACLCSIPHNISIRPSFLPPDKELSLPKTLLIYRNICLYSCSYLRRALTELNPGVLFSLHSAKLPFSYICEGVRMLLRFCCGFFAAFIQRTTQQGFDWLSRQTFSPF